MPAPRIDTELPCIYRHYNAAGELLYLGASLNPLRRLYEHTCSSSWVAGVTRVEIEHFEDRHSALVAENKAIAEKQPRYNAGSLAFEERPTLHKDFGDLLRAAGRLVGWTQAKLAELADLSPSTVKKFESGEVTNWNMSTVRAMLQALRDAGVIFLDGEL